MSETVIIAAISSITTLLVTVTGGAIAALASRRNKQAEAQKTEAEAEQIAAQADQISAQVRVLYLENERHLLERVAVLERDKYTCATRLDALEMERRRDALLLMESRRVQESLETELSTMRERYEGQIMQLHQENKELRQKLERLASRVETGELKNDGRLRPS